MSSMWGNKIRISLFGESHGPAIGVVIDGLPPGFELNMEQIAAHMRRRAPGNFPWSTTRKEADRAEILSGMYNGKTCGTPLAAIIHNTNTRSGDYARFGTTPRPGHSDLTGHLRYNGANDPRGGGHFSGRITAPLTFAGAICMQMLKARGITVSAHIYEIAGIRDVEVDESQFPFEVATKDFPVVDDACGLQMQDAIQSAYAKKDSVGGIVEAVATGFPAGIGNPFFDRVETRLAAIMMSIPATKGVEIGRGFDVARSTGSQNNDPIFVDEAGRITRKSNHAGGVEGGISNGMPIVLRCAFKPTASVGVEQDSINLETMKNDKLEVHGRHDPCVVPRAVPVVESAMALTLLDLLQ